MFEVMVQRSTFCLGSKEVEGISALEKELLPCRRKTQIFEEN
jgi:hypothetical protein